MLQNLLGCVFYIIGGLLMLGSAFTKEPATDGILLLIVGTLWFATAPAEDK